MYIKPKYSLFDMIVWTRRELFIFFSYAFLTTFLFEVVELRFLHLPWPAVGMIGTAVAFLIGFQNNAAYDRIWEARKIWGSIINNSRGFAIFARDLLKKNEDDSELKTLVNRHFAWLTALRFALRESRPWEVFNHDRTNRNYLKRMFIPEWNQKLEDELPQYLTHTDLAAVLTARSKATRILSLQSAHLADLKSRGELSDLNFLGMEKLINDLLELQGKCERIKNFPYPRQYASIGNVLVWLLILLLPYTLIPEFEEIGVALQRKIPVVGDKFIWCAIPFLMLVSWTFHTMERIGRASENPFEGTANDVPISTISRNLEIEIRDLLHEPVSTLPDPFPISHNVQM